MTQFKVGDRVRVKNDDALIRHNEEGIVGGDDHGKIVVKFSDASENLTTIFPWSSPPTMPSSLCLISASSFFTLTLSPTLNCVMGNLLLASPGFQTAHSSAGLFPSPSLCRKSGTRAGTKCG